MAKRRSKRRSPRAQEQLMLALRRYVRTSGKQFLEDHNITSIGVGHKITKGRRTREVCLQFTVREKNEREGGVGIEALGTVELPETIDIAGEAIPTDVIERDYQLTFQEVGIENLDDRKLRQDPVFPGVSISHQDGTAGTLGLIVFDNKTGKECLLSNWHVLDHPFGDADDAICQPGPHDDSDIQANTVGQLIRSHLGEAGDCAIASLDGRQYEREIHELDLFPTSIARVELGDHVIKSGRTTGVTRAVVRRVDVIAEIDYPGVGPQLIGAFEYEPRADAPPGMEVSLGGDSGSAVLLATSSGNPKPILGGLHFAGERTFNPDEHGLACYAHSVFKKLNISLEPLEADEIEAVSTGYDPYFLGTRVRVPWLDDDQYADAVKLDGSHLIPYTHFSVCQSQEKGFCYFSAWNVDGMQIKTLSDNGLDFRKEHRIATEHQHNNSLYSHNPLDKGHVARRASLCWGSLAEAEQANRDSYTFTNCLPQHERFNRSSLGGLWGQLENAIFKDVKVEDLRISVIAGPVFGADDKLHRGVPIPSEFWKVVAYRDQDDGGELKVRAFILSQKDLLSGLETLELDEFHMYQVPLDTLFDRTGLSFAALDDFDVHLEALGLESLRRRPAAVVAHEIRDARDLVL